MKLVIYFPIDKDQSELKGPRPNIENQKDALVTMIKSEPVQEEEPAPQGWGNNNQTPAERNFKRFHKDWYTVLAYSKGTSSESNNRGFSLTGYTTELTPTMELMILRGEVLPFAVFRIFQNVVNNKLNIIEYELENVIIDSQSTGGSGGENRFTENITIIPESYSHKMITIDIETYEFTSFCSSKFDYKTGQGARTVANETARQALGIDKFGLLDFSDAKQKQIAHDLGIGRINNNLTFAVSVHSKPKLYKKIELNSRSLGLLKSKLAQTFKRPETDVVAVYTNDGWEIEKDEDIKVDRIQYVFCKFADGTFSESD